LTTFRKLSNLTDVLRNHPSKFYAEKTWNSMILYNLKDKAEKCNKKLSETKKYWQRVKTADFFASEFPAEKKRGCSPDAKEKT